MSGPVIFPGASGAGWGGVRRLLDVILHIGAHRTGTTTLQRFLSRNRDGLARDGVAVWGPRDLRAGLSDGLVKAPHRITPDVLRRGERSCARMQRACDQLDAAGVDTLLVSEENMIGSMPNNLLARALYPHSGFRLQRFAPAFADRCTTIALGIRSYDRQWASALAFCMRQGFGAPARDILDEIAVQKRTWRDVIADAARAFPGAKLVVWPFEALVALPEAQCHAMTGRAVPGPVLGLGGWENRTPGPPVVGAARGTRPGSGVWRPFTTAQTEKLRDTYAEDLAWLRAGAGGLAQFIESPAMLPGSTGSGRGLRHDQRQRGVG